MNVQGAVCNLSLESRGGAGLRGSVDRGPEGRREVADGESGQVQKGSPGKVASVGDV